MKNTFLALCYRKNKVNCILNFWSNFIAYITKLDLFEHNISILKCPISYLIWYTSKSKLPNLGISSLQRWPRFRPTLCTATNSACAGVSRDLWAWQLDTASRKTPFWIWCEQPSRTAPRTVEVYQPMALRVCRVTSSNEKMAQQYRTWHLKTEGIILHTVFLLKVIWY